MAIDDNYIRSNPSDNALRELKKSREFIEEKRSALTAEQEKIFLDYLMENPMYRHWYPVFAIMVGSGLRVGEITGLRWQDIDLENGVIDVNHTLVYYSHRIVKPGEKKGSYFAINSTKTPANKRKIPMLDFVKEAFEMEKQYQAETEIRCNVTVSPPLRNVPDECVFSCQSSLREPDARFLFLTTPPQHEGQKNKPPFQKIFELS